MAHLDKHKILSDDQHGFRKRHSCESQLIITLNDLAKGLNSKHQIDAVLLNFSKAFDRVAYSSAFSSSYSFMVSVVKSYSGSGLSLLVVLSVS